MISGVDLYKRINESWLTISTCAISNSLISKYFEIGLCGSVICGNFPQYESEIKIKKNIIYIDETMTNEEIINIIKNALDDKIKLQEYSKNLSEYISDNYMMKNGLELFNELIEKTYGKK